MQKRHLLLVLSVIVAVSVVSLTQVGFGSASKVQRVAESKSYDDSAEWDSIRQMKQERAETEAKAKVAAQEEALKKARAEKARKAARLAKARKEAARKALVSKRVASSRTKYSTKSSTSSAAKDGRWLGSHSKYDSVAVATLRSKGVSSNDIRMLMAIHHGEGGPNSVNTQGTARTSDDMHGGWQLSAGMADGHPWWDPAWASTRALKYCQGRYGSVAAAYAHKKSEGWY